MTLTWANQITILRVLLITPFVICMLKINQTPSGHIMRYTALAIFLFMCVSDALDGYMARIKKQSTKFGAFLDGPDSRQTPDNMRVRNISVDNNLRAGIHTAVGGRRNDNRKRPDTAARIHTYIPYHRKAVFQADICRKSCHFPADLDGRGNTHRT